MKPLLEALARLVDRLDAEAVVGLGMALLSLIAIAALAPK